METLRTFFNGQSKANGLSGNQQGLFGTITPRYAPADVGNGSPNTTSGGAHWPAHYTEKPKDSDNYFYIMWRS